MKILFICTGNTCRSPMARALLLHRLQVQPELVQNREIQVWSAGLSTLDGMPASAEAVEVLRQEGIDISQHRTLLVKNSLIEDADLILTMTISQRDYLQDRFPEKSVIIYTLSEFTGDVTGEVIDPYGYSREAYQKSLSQLKVLIDLLYHKVIELN